MANTRSFWICLRRCTTKSSGELDGAQAGPGGGRELDGEGVAWTDGAGGEGDGHDAGLEEGASLLVAADAGAFEPRAEVVQLEAGGAEAGDLDDGGGAEVEAGS